MADAFTQQICNYALENDDNLTIFIRTAKSFDELRKTLISGFASALAEKLRAKYSGDDGWTIDATTLIQSPLDTKSYLSVRNKLWHQDLKVQIGAQTPIYYAVGWLNWNRDHLIEGNNIFRIIQALGIRSRQDQWCPWYTNDNQFNNWFKEDALISMRQAIKGERPGEILDFFYNELVTITEILKNHLKTP